MLRRSRFLAGILAGTGTLAFLTATGILLILTNRIPLPEFLGGGAVAPDKAIDVIAERLACKMEQTCE